MKLLLVLMIVSSAFAGLANQLLTTDLPNVVNTLIGSNCNQDVTMNFKKALYDFSTNLYKHSAKLTDHHFALSQYSVWLALAALAEGTSGPAQDELLNVLNLPKEECLRRKYYEIATKLETPGDDVKLDRKRFLVLDEEVQVNETWARWAREAGLLDTLSLPLKAKPEAAIESLRKAIDHPSSLSLTNGNSILVDSLDYYGLWSTAFPDADFTPNVPFYDDQNNQIGTVDMMNVKRKVKLARLPLLNAKVVEIPVGKDSRYTMLVLENLSKTHIKETIELFENTIILDIVESLTESLVPLQVSLPRFMLRTMGDLRSALEQMGVRALWNDPAGTSQISVPAAIPSEYLQSVNVNITSSGVDEPAPMSSSLQDELSSLATGLEAAIGYEFTANRPFLFALLDSVTYTCLFAGAFTQPDKMSEIGVQ